jgi:hypothetical protein
MITGKMRHGTFRAATMICAIGLAAVSCSDDPAQPGTAPVYCSGSLSPKTTTICNGAAVILTLSDGPANGDDIAWSNMDEGRLSSAQNHAVFEAPSAGAGTARIRVRWPGPCELTSYVAFEPCDGGRDGAAAVDSAIDDGAAAVADADHDDCDDANIDAPDGG